MTNALIRLTVKELDEVSNDLAKYDRFESIVDSDMYTDDMTLSQFNYFSRQVDRLSRDNDYTVSQYKYIIDKAITLATI